MSSINVALNKPINSYSSEYGYIYTADKINNGNYTMDYPYIWVSAEDAVSDQWIIIDLGDTYTVNHITFYSAYYEFTPEMAVKDFRVGVSSAGTEVGDFFTVLSGTLDLPSSSTPPPFMSQEILPVPARFVKLYVDNNHGDLNYVLAGELEVYSSDLVQDTVLLLSSAVITKEELTSSAVITKEELTSSAVITKEELTSSAYIIQPIAVLTSSAVITKEELTSSAYINRPVVLLDSSASIISNFVEILTSSAVIVQSSTSLLASSAVIYTTPVATLTSSAYIKRFAELSTLSSSARIIKEFLTSINSNSLIYRTDTVTLDSSAVITKEELTSSAYINRPIVLLDSSANIIKESDPVLITSAAKIYNSGSLSQLGGLFTMGTGTAVEDFRNIYIGSITNRSKQAIVDDIVTNPEPMDLTAVSTPLSYNNYDWAYDWVTRTWNNAAIIFEARSADELYELSGAEWAEISNGQVIAKSDVKRYHQWRMHVWASGSRDVELHQFSIKCYSVYKSSGLYGGLIL